MSIASLVLLVAGQVVPAPPFVSLGMLDPNTYSGGQFVTRVSFAEGTDAFSGSSTWAHELKVNLSIGDGVGFRAVLPIGHIQPRRGDDGFVGNVALGMLGGFDIADVVQVGIGVDAYLPSSPSVPITSSPRRGLISVLNPYEPQLWVPRLLSTRGRLLVGHTKGPFHAGAEFGATLGTTVETPRSTVVLISGSALVSYTFRRRLEPFLEVAGTTQIAGTGQIDPPFMITPGVRLHASDFFDPAFFMSFNFVQGSAIIFGVDLAFVARPNITKDRERLDDMDLDEIKFDDIDP